MKSKIHSPLESIPLPSSHQTLDIIQQSEIATPAQPLLKKISTDSSKPSMTKTILAAFLIVTAGSITGFGMSRAFGSSLSSADLPQSAYNLNSNQIKTGAVFGSQDKDTFRDTVEGVIVTGGVDGEGSHHLVRPGGASQNVYLTSSVMDLDQFLDHKVKIWGETYAAQKAGWLMDVGRLEILELNAAKPTE